MPAVGELSQQRELECFSLQSFHNQHKPHHNSGQPTTIDNNTTSRLPTTGMMSRTMPISLTAPPVKTMAAHRKRHWNE